MSRLVSYEPPPGTKTHPLLDIVPMMTEEEFASLVRSIRRLGQMRPIARTSDGTILDGRCRLMACLAAGVEPRFQTVDPEDPEGFIFSVNCMRQNY
jgi:hypothetical protein